MKITNRNLTLVQNTGTDTVNCLAGCRVELNAFEAASLLVPGTPGFRLRCVLVGNDPGPADSTVFTYPRTMRFTNIVDLLNVNQVFEDDVSDDMLDEDAPDVGEIQAEFTLINLSTGQRRVSRSNQVAVNF